MLFNGYTIEGNSLANIFVSLGNYYSTATSNNDGTLFPSFIRLNGYLSSSEIGTNSSKIILFFQNVNPFY